MVGPVARPGERVDDKSLDFHRIGFEVKRNSSITPNRTRRHSIRPEDRVRHHYNLFLIRWVSKELGVSHHRSIENDFPRNLGLSTKTFSLKNGTVFEDQYALLTWFRLFHVVLWTQRRGIIRGPFQSFTLSSSFTVRSTITVSVPATPSICPISSMILLSCSVPLVRILRIE
jgi:hypothetical protein